jgi:hypothetical protein
LQLAQLPSLQHLALRYDISRQYQQQLAADAASAWGCCLSCVSL